LANASHALFRCSNYPADIPPQERHERGHALTVAFQAKAGEEGFQIYVASIIGTKITEERSMMDEPSGVRNDQTETSVDGAQALAFHGFDAVMGQTYEVGFIKGDFLYEVSTYKQLEPGLESDLYKSVNRRYAAEEFALQLRALCSDHPVDGPSFDQVALRVALSFGRVVAEDEPAGQLGRRTQHSLVMLDHDI